MQVATNWKRAIKYPAQAQAAMADLNRKLARRGKTWASASECTWSFEYSLGIADGSPRRERVMARLSVSYGGSSGSAAMQPIGEYLSSHKVPQEILSEIDPPHADVVNTIHHARLALRLPNGRETNLLVQHGYSRKGLTYLAGQIEGQPIFSAGFPIFYRLDVDGNLNISMSGFLPETALQRYIATPEGGSFQYEKITYNRLSGEDISLISQPDPTPDEESAPASP